MSVPDGFSMPPPPSNDDQLCRVRAPPAVVAAIAIFGLTLRSAVKDSQSSALLYTKLEQAIGTRDTHGLLQDIERAREHSGYGADLHGAIKHAIECDNLDAIRILLDTNVPASIDDLKSAARMGNIPSRHFL
ncbi:Hypothetical protein R9X50_00140800 [Acrodontium crateriforme]|uniref:Uncharacterized protein n=1 Tax=Acrodontium crateriforme TaxID=150365 RepID=A0AAQ3M2E9_9PEZI|nr:Hypothetical protein R9X50_00140800 [Acrodontium crateriforme]